MDDDQTESGLFDPTIEEAREIRDRWHYFMGRSMSFITDAPDCEIAAWQVSFALGTDNCIGHTMSSKAQELDVGVACMSKAATKICRMLNIPPSNYMMSEKSRESYRQLRRKQEYARLGNGQATSKPIGRKISKLETRPAAGRR